MTLSTAATECIALVALESNMGMEHWWNDNDSRNTCPPAILTVINPMSTGLEPNPSLPGE